MKATLTWLSPALVAALWVSAAHAQYFGACPCPPVAPDACGPGFYAPNAYGAYYGPNYYLYPGFAPFNGMVFAGGGPGGPGGPGGLGSPSFPTHPYARSPRDFFMDGTENPYAVNAIYPSLAPIQPVYVAPLPPPVVTPVAPLVPAPAAPAVPPVAPPAPGAAAAPPAAPGGGR